MEFDKHLNKYLNEKEIADLLASFSLSSKHAALLNTRKISDEKFLLHLKETECRFNHREENFGALVASLFWQKKKRCFIRNRGIRSYSMN